MKLIIKSDDPNGMVEIIDLTGEDYRNWGWPGLISLFWSDLFFVFLACFWVFSIGY